MVFPATGGQSWLSVLVGDSYPQLSPEAAVPDREIYCQQIWLLGLPCQAKGTHSSSGRRGLSPGKEREWGPGGKGRQGPWQKPSFIQADAVPRRASQSARLSSKACKKPWTRSSRLAESLCKRVRWSWVSPLAWSPSRSSCSVTAAWSLSSCCFFRSSAYMSRAFWSML